MSVNRRRQLVGWCISAFGLVGLVLLVALFRTQPWLQRGLMLFVAWQSFWCLVRLALSVGIWQRETELGAREKMWLAVTAPLPLLLAVWYGRGRLSGWVRAGEES